MLNRTRGFAMGLSVFLLPAGDVIAESRSLWIFRFTFHQESGVPQRKASFDFPFHSLRGFTRANLFGFSTAMVADENPPRAISFSDSDAHPASLSRPFTIASTSTEA